MGSLQQSRGRIDTYFSWSGPETGSSPIEARCHDCRSLPSSAVPGPAYSSLSSLKLSSMALIWFCKSATRSRCCCTTSAGARSTKLALLSFARAACRCLSFSASSFCERALSASTSIRPASDTYTSNSGVTCVAAWRGFAVCGPHSRRPTPARALMKGVSDRKSSAMLSEQRTNTSRFDFVSIV